MAHLPNIQYCARDFQAIKDALEQYVTDNEPELWSDFFESNLGVTLIELVAYVGDVLSFAIDRDGEEAFPVTAQLYSSMLKHAKYVGYRADAQTSASVDVVAIPPLPTQLTTFGMLVSKGTLINVGDVPFEVIEDFLFPPGTTSVAFTMAQGKTVSDEFVSDGTAYQRFTTSVGAVIGSSWEIYVDGLLWSEVEYLLLTEDTHSYQTEFNGDAMLTIEFGNGSNGVIPPLGKVIQIVYRIGVGAAGNIPANAINASVPVSINATTQYIQIYNPTAAAGGADRETIDSIRRNMPLYIRTVDKAITKEDYETLSRTFTDPSLGSIAKATAKLRDGTLLVHQGTDPGIPVEIPAGTQVQIGNEFYNTYVQFFLDGANMGLFVDPNTIDIYVWAFDGTSYVPASSALKGALLTFLMDRSVVTTTPMIRDGTNKPVSVNLGIIYVHRDYVLATVGTAIDAAIEAFFTDVNFDPGGSFVLSDFYNVVENVPGVDHFVIQSPTSDVTSLDTEMLVKGTITYTLEFTQRVTPDIIGKY